MATTMRIIGSELFPEHNNENRVGMEIAEKPNYEKNKNSMFKKNINSMFRFSQYKNTKSSK